MADQLTLQEDYSSGTHRRQHLSRTELISAPAGIVVVAVSAPDCPQLGQASIQWHP